MSRSLRVFNVLAGALFLAAIVWAEGGWRAILGKPAILAFLLVSLGLFVAAGFTEANVSPGVREDRGNRWVIPALAALGVAEIAVCLGFDRAGIATLDGAWLRWLGVALYALGGALRLAPVFVLGRRFSGLVAIQEGHALVTDGLYARIRNPSYLGLLINAVGMALTFRSGPGVLLALLMALPLHARMNAEERLLEVTFGEPYRAYRARTARLVPGVY
jgi:protein-S-isoprenylcysteine O-methyltransferase Ste14